MRCHGPEKFQELQWTRLPDGQPKEEFVAHIVRLLAARNVIAGGTAPGSAVQQELAPASSPVPASPATSTAAAGLPLRSVTPAIRKPSGIAANPRLWLGRWRTVGLAATAVLGIAAGWLLRPLLLPPPSAERPESGLQVSAPQPLFSVETGTDFGRKQYHPTLDGERFLVNAITEDPTTRFMTVITQWHPPRRK